MDYGSIPCGSDKALVVFSAYREMNVAFLWYMIDWGAYRIVGSRVMFKSALKL